MRSCFSSRLVVVLSLFGNVVFAQDPLAAVAVRPAVDISGTWDGIQRSQGGIGTTLLLSRDSSFVLVLGAMVDLKYRVEGSNFILLNDDTTAKPLETQKLTFREGRAVLAAHGCSRTLTRIDSVPGDSGLVGKWKSLHMTGIPAYDEYTPGGTIRLRVPIQVQKGVFAVVGRTLLFETNSPQHESWNADFEIKADTLTVTIRGDQHRFLRARPLIPFDVQQPAPPKGMVCS